MSSLLEQAIADAKMLKEAAKKNLEAQILENYSVEIKKELENLFEADDAGLGDLGSAADAATPTAAATPDANAAGGKQTPAVKKVMDKIPAAYLGESGMQEIEIDLDSLVEKVSQLEEEVQPERLAKDTAQVEEAIDASSIASAEQKEAQAKESAAKTSTDVQKLKAQKAKEDAEAQKKAENEKKTMA